MSKEEAKLFIGNLSYNTRDRDLEELFGKYGKVKEARVALDSSTGRNKGFGFVTMEDSADAQDAIRNTDGADLLGRTLRVEISTGVRGGAGGGGGGRRDRDDRDRGYDRGGRDRDDRGYGRDAGRRDDDRGRDDRGSYGRDRDSSRRDDDRSYGRDRDRGGGSYRDDRKERRDRSRDRDGY